MLLYGRNQHKKQFSSNQIFFLIYFPELKKKSKCNNIHVQNLKMATA